MDAPTAHRDEFERRLLALVRDFFDRRDEDSPQGYEIGDFIVVYEFFERMPESEPLPPWTGSMRPGFYSSFVSLSASSSNYWTDEALLTEALSRVRDIRAREEAEARAQASAPADDDLES